MPSTPFGNDELVPYQPFKTMLKEVGEEVVMENVLGDIVNGTRPDQIAKALKIPFYEFMKWLHEDQKRLNAYYRAQELWAEKLHSEVIEIADNATEEDVQVAKLRIKTRQEVASNYNRKRFGTVSVPESAKFSGGITINITGVDKPQFVEVTQNGDDRTQNGNLTGTSREPITIDQKEDK